MLCQPHSACLWRKAAHVIHLSSIAVFWNWWIGLQTYWGHGLITETTSSNPATTTCFRVFLDVPTLGEMLIGKMKSFSCGSSWPWLRLRKALYCAWDRPCSPSLILIWMLAYSLRIFTLEFIYLVMISTEREQVLYSLFLHDWFDRGCNYFSNSVFGDAPLLWIV